MGNKQMKPQPSPEEVVPANSECAGNSTKCCSMAEFHKKPRQSICGIFNRRRKETPIPANSKGMSKRTLESRGREAEAFEEVLFSVREREQMIRNAELTNDAKRLEVLLAKSTTMAEEVIRDIKKDQGHKRSSVEDN